MNFFSNGGSNGCCNTCDLVLLLLLLNNCGCGCGMTGGATNGCGCGMSSCDIIWLILILSCLCK